MLTAAVQRLVRTTDNAIARVCLSARPERAGLICFLFHSLFRDRRQIALDHVDPLDRTTVRDLRDLIAYYLAHGYRFITPRHLLEGPLDPAGKFALLTFDDGYFNNTLALPILEEHGVPATFFISTANVVHNKSFWWDALYRQRLAQGASPSQVHREGLAMKSLPTEQIEADLLARFGPRALEPIGDIDRPFSPTELRAFAAHPLVHLGNHTHNHAILTNYAPADARKQVAAAQDALREMTGALPCAIAYPNGAHAPQIEQTCRDLGLRLGFTIRPAKTPLPLPLDPASPQSSLMRLGRFVPHSGDRIVTQCRTYRCDLQLYGTFRTGYLRLVRRRKTSM
jgi:peptidoglycan/xylan/chitin deacetylase (PgdA/CDA1 family)